MKFKFYTHTPSGYDTEVIIEAKSMVEAWKKFHRDFGDWRAYRVRRV